jgi:hypothetical protein
MIHISESMMQGLKPQPVEHLPQRPKISAEPEKFMITAAT